jgi:prepilin-type N-terminal cleavage/methylation domain-containing protein
MKTIRLKSAHCGFTLIELLVVIAIIAILAGLLFTAMGGMQQKAMKTRAKAELQTVALAIDAYRSKLGYYPPDNRNNYGVNTLFYELVGCTRVNNNATISTFTPLDGSPPVSSTALRAQTSNLIEGIGNSSTSSSSSDEGRVAQSFLKELKLTQYADSNGIRRLGVAIEGPNSAMVGNLLTPFRYNSSNPTNNPNSYDLWVDIIVGGKTNRISNWSATPQVL